MKKTQAPKKLSLCKLTVRVLSKKDLRDVVGGTEEGPTLECTSRWICPSADTNC